jgi:hypothetical protein
MAALVRHSASQVAPAAGACSIAAANLASTPIAGREESRMPLKKSVTQYQTDYFTQEVMISDHMGRSLNTFQTNKAIFEKDGSEAARILAYDAASTYKLINDTKKGVCAALCVKWMKMKIAGNNAYPAMARLKTDRTFAKAVMRQTDAKSPGLQQEHLAAAYKVTWTKKEMNFSRPLNLMAEDILAIPATFYLLSFNMKTGSHVIALSSQNLKEVMVFDPNFGEFKLPGGKISHFLADLLEQGYEAMPKSVNGLSRWTP